MGVRAPLDVDLEDKLVFGLSPLRFGYLIIAGLSAMAVWGQRWAPGPLRLAACLPILGVGAALAWVRWRGRGLDQWLLDGGLYVVMNHSLRVSSKRLAAARPRSGTGHDRHSLRLAQIGPAIARLTLPDIEEALV